MLALAENENDENQRIKRLTIKIIKEKKPETIVQLISLVRKEENIPAERLFITIQELEDEKNLQFEESFFPESTAEYVFSIRATWYWIILLLSILTAFFVFSIPDNIIPQIYARSALGIMFVLYFPGYAIIKAIYPINVPLELRSVILDNIERIVLSLGLSLAVTPLIGLTLYFTPLGLNLVQTTLSLLAVTVSFSTLAIWREYHARKAIFLRRLIVVTEYQLSDDAISFFDIEGLVKKRLVLIKQIPFKEITHVENFGNELSITSNGVSDIFYMKYDSQSVTELREKIRSMR